MSCFRIRKNVGFNFVLYVMAFGPLGCRGCDFRKHGRKIWVRSNDSECVLAKDASKFVAPNGVNLRDVPFVDALERQTAKARLGLTNKKIALFMGSWHQPNIECNELGCVCRPVKCLKLVQVSRGAGGRLAS